MAVIHRINNIPSWNSINAGRAVPTKFNLSGYQGLDIFAVGYPASQKIDCASNIPINVVEETVAAGSSSLSYNATLDQYNYVWKTDKAWAGSCRQLAVQLKDGTYYSGGRLRQFCPKAGDKTNGNGRTDAKIA